MIIKSDNFSYIIEIKLKDYVFKDISYLRFIQYAKGFDDYLFFKTTDNAKIVQDLGDSGLNDEIKVYVSGVLLYTGYIKKITTKFHNSLINEIECETIFSDILQVSIDPSVSKILNRKIANVSGFINSIRQLLDFMDFKNVQIINKISFLENYKINLNLQKFKPVNYITSYNITLWDVINKMTSRFGIKLTFQNNKLILYKELNNNLNGDLVNKSTSRIFSFDKTNLYYEYKAYYTKIEKNNINGYINNDYKLSKESLKDKTVRISKKLNNYFSNIDGDEIKNILSNQYTLNRESALSLVYGINDLTLDGTNIPSPACTIKINDPVFDINDEFNIDIIDTKIDSSIITKFILKK